MQAAPIRVLLVEDEPADAEFVKRSLSAQSNASFELMWLERLSDALEQLRSDRFDVMLLDLGLPEYCGLEALQEVRRQNQDIPIVVLTGLHDEKTALEALEQGAQDYLGKGKTTIDEALYRSIRYAVQRQQLLKARIERELAIEARAKLAAIVECSADAILGETLDGVISSWNGEAEKLLGYSAKEALGRTISFLVPPQCAGDLAQIRAAVQRGESVRHFETRFIRRDGQWIDISLSLSPIRDEDGKVVGMAKIARDISDRKRAEQALRDSQERLELAIWGSSDGLGDWRLDTGEARWSPQLKEMLGYSGDEFESNFTAISSRMHPDDRGRALSEIAEGVRRRQPVLSEFRLRTKAGEYRWFQGRGRAVYDDTGTPHRFAGALTDISDRKRMEAELARRDEQLQQSTKLEAVGSLAGGIAHEFNNLLQAIRGYGQYAMEGLSPSEQRYRDLEQVVKAADRAADLTRQLLGFSRRQVLERASFDHREVVTDFLKLLRPLIGEHIEIDVSLATDMEPLCADQGLLQQMLLNLCINARDAMPTGGRLALKTQRAELSEKYCQLHPTFKPGVYAVFSVADTGCGMSPEVKERIFEPFFTTKGIGRGTGLGLAMVYGSVQQHGGMVHVYSESGVGTTFKIYLPLEAGDISVVDQAAASPVAGGKETILVADDEPMVRDLAVRILTSAGYSVLVAADGAEAVDQLEANADVISLAILDAVMPKLTGHQVYDRIRLTDNRLPVIFCSGYDPEMLQVKSLTDQGLRLVQKPCDPDVLLRTVREVLDAQRVLEVSPCTA